MKKAIQKKIDQRRLDGVCIACGDKPPAAREICTTCKGRYEMAKKKAIEMDRLEEYEAKAIDAGLIAAPKPGRKLYDNPFRDLLFEDIL